MKDFDAIVIGAGIFGCTITRALRDAGKSVLLVSKKERLSGSQASGNLMKPGWFAGLGKAVYEPALALLERQYGIRDLTFAAGKGVVRKDVKVHWVPLESVLSEEKLDATVTDVGADGTVFVEGQGEFRAPLVVVCAGYWTQQLLGTGPTVVGKQGVSLRWTEEECPAQITPWAPYKQIVQYSYITGPGKSAMWAGDGTAILPKNWTGERMRQSVDRVIKHVGAHTKPLLVQGIRPYVKGAKPCFLEELWPGTWVATGGAKNGQLAAGWAAHKILEATS